MGTPYTPAGRTLHPLCSPLWAASPCGGGQGSPLVSPSSGAAAGGTTGACFYLLVHIDRE
ncbi:hypothetical protein KDH_50510 [Dictyobacter sp. S3.2.2.5]|uniref:Uncharacterized protein n=1 Tax=Dictyobacter halimunensis TaxID=3026934 RepID=A0ABQ6G0M9_9CHLR|nr:hypothetical protein KDH_50510 [Dictyobacter sp. S3.2.2.5]